MSRNRTFILAILVLPVAWLISLALPEEKNPVLVSLPEHDRFWTWKVHQTQKFDGVIIGDSRVYRGISPYVLDSVFEGSQFLNFGFSSGSLNPEVYQQAELRLDPDADRKTIIIGISPWALTELSSGNEALRRELSRPYSEVLDRLYFSYYTSRFKAIQPLAIKMELLGQNTYPHEKYYSTYHENGWVGSKLIPERPRSAIKHYVKLFEDEDVSERLIQDLLLQTKQWTERGILVYAVRMPAHPEVIETENTLGKFNENDLTRLFENAGGHWIDLSKQQYHSYDGNHFTTKAAQRFSRDLAEQIKRKQQAD